jgi:hypothetical protein
VFALRTFTLTSHRKHSLKITNPLEKMSRRSCLGVAEGVELIGLLSARLMAMQVGIADGEQLDSTLNSFEPLLRDVSSNKSTYPKQAMLLAQHLPHPGKTRVGT